MLRTSTALPRGRLQGVQVASYTRPQWEPAPPFAPSGMVNPAANHRITHSVPFCRR